jgi:dihydropteroate synthase
MDGKSKLSKTIITKSGVIDLSTPAIMGILNVTPDSFYDGAAHFSTSAALAHAATMIDAGVDIIDIGGQSTRPGSTRISAQEELDRIALVIQALKNYKKDIILSVDTYQPEVAKACAQLGADIINDISGGTFQNNLLATVAQIQLPYIGMHIQGSLATMQQNPTYTNVVEEIYQYFNKLAQQCNTLGISQLIIDPGFGFGKTIEHNYTLLAALQRFTDLPYPILVGISRKSFIYKKLGIEAKDSLAATSALHLLALQNGANILRVHDVAEAKQVVQLYLQLKEA